MSADFLLELLSEEIPARMQPRARADLQRMMAEALQGAALGHGAITAFSTPRRLALIVRDVAAATEAASEELKGPRTSAPPEALEGFLRKAGLTQDQLEDRDGIWFARIDRPGRSASAIIGEAVSAIVADFPWPKSMRWGDGDLRWVRPLHSIIALLGEEIVPIEAGGIRSGATTLGHRFHHPGPITIGGAKDYAEKLRACHVLVDQEERETLIRGGAARAAKDAGFALIEDEGLVVENAGLTEWPMPLLGHFDPDFLDVPREVIVLTMRTNQKYFACAIPPLLLQGRGTAEGGGGAGSEAVGGEVGGLAPAFVCIANIDAKDGGASIIEGNRRVLAARLADARFFWEQDVKVPLEEQAQKLDGIVFHEKLGTVADKVERVAKLARWLVEEGIVGTLSPAGRGASGSGPSPGWSDPVAGEGAHVSSAGAEPPHPNPLPAGEREQLADQAERAARLAKADLVTGMVGEFPELQGVIGGYLAEAQGEPKAVADAIRDHYKPVGQGDEVPTAPVTVALALADKLDTVICFFSVGELPSGSRDPFAIRRAALGVVSMLLGSGIRMSFVDTLITSSHLLFAQLDQASFWEEAAATYFALEELHGESEALDHYYEALQRRDRTERQGQLMAQLHAAVSQVRSFFADRLKVQQREAGARHDLIDAVFALGREDDLVRLLARVRALQAFVETGEGADLLTAYKRAANILKKEGHSQSAPAEPVEASGGAGAGTLRQAQGERGGEPVEERALTKALDKAESKATAAIDKEDFTAAMAALASLRGPIDAFFDKVKVNADDKAIRARRLNLLARFRSAVNRVADFSKIEG